jgi:hypothetical protein
VSRGAAAADIEHGRTEVIPTLAARAAVPTGLSASLALTIGATRKDPQFCTHEPLGPSISVEGGSGGGMLGVGVAGLCLDSPLRPRYGLALRAVYVRTWGHPWSTRADQSYIGGVVDATVLLTLRVGILKHVGDRPAGGRDVIFAVGGGIGF